MVRRATRAGERPTHRRNALPRRSRAVFGMGMAGAGTGARLNQMTDFRWLVTIDYRTDNGPVGVDHHIEEIAELSDLVEAGPHWDTIEGIRIRLNPRRRQFGGTVEQSR